MGYNKDFTRIFAQSLTVKIDLLGGRTNAEAGFDVNKIPTFTLQQIPLCWENWNYFNLRLKIPV